MDFRFSFIFIIVCDAFFSFWQIFDLHSANGCDILHQHKPTMYTICCRLFMRPMWDAIRAMSHTVNDGTAVKDAIPPFTCSSTQSNVKWNGIVVHKQNSNRFLLNDEWCLQLVDVAVRQPMLRNTHYNFQIFFSVYLTWTMFAFGWFLGTSMQFGDDANASAVWARFERDFAHDIFIYSIRLRLSFINYIWQTNELINNQSIYMTTTFMHPCLY